MTDGKKGFKLFEEEELEELSPVVETDKESDPNLASELPKIKEPAKVLSATRIGKVIAGKGLNVRAEASGDSSILGILQPRVLITVISTENGWHKIVYGTGIGYVMEQYVR